MADIFPKRITYRELKDGTFKYAYIPQDSKFPITSHMTPYLREALITCPGNIDDAKTFMYLFVDEGDKEIGRVYLFGTRIKGGDRVYGAQTGCGLEVIEEYRDTTVGAELMLFSPTNDEYDFALGAGVSQKVLPMYRKLKYHIFEVPQYFKTRNVRFINKPLESKSRSNLWLHNFELKLNDFPNFIRYNKLIIKFKVKKETIIPQWASDMIASSGYKFMELHDREWLQWNLDHNTYGYDEDIQSFYSVLDRKKKPMGFFMTKERMIKNPGRNHGFVIGTVVEWESCDHRLLSEVDINILAMYSFSKRIDAIFTLACESGTAGQLKKMGFRQRASFKVGVKDKKKKCQDIGNQNLWRLRYGMTNMTIL